MKRRHFLRTAIVSSIAVSSTFRALALSKNNRYRNNIGIQLYTLRNELQADLRGTLKRVADAGYKQVEPYGFPNALEMIDAAKECGLAVNSSHFAWESVTDPDKEGVAPFEEILEKANEAGLSHLVVPYVHEGNRETLDDYKRLAENCNKAAVVARKAGIKLAYHNHSFEFEPKQGSVSGYDILMEEFSPEMMFEVDVFWVAVGGRDPLELIRNLKGRVSQLHLKDLKRRTKLPIFGRVPEEAFKELGNGMIAIEPLIEAAETVGVEHCHVEQDQSPDPINSVRQSIQFLEQL